MRPRRPRSLPRTTRGTRCRAGSSRRPSGSPAQEAIDPDTFERPPEAGQDGVVYAGSRFTDKNGSNVVLLVHQVEGGGGDMNNRRLWIYHYVEASGKRRVLRTVRDQEENCELDNVAGFVEGSLAVTDPRRRRARRDRRSPTTSAA